MGLHLSGAPVRLSSSAHIHPAGSATGFNPTRVQLKSTLDQPKYARADEFSYLVLLTCDK